MVGMRNRGGLFSSLWLGIEEKGREDRGVTEVVISSLRAHFNYLISSLPPSSTVGGDQTFNT
jgi:hypothetical protein